MKVLMFSIYDEKAGAHMQPFFMVNEALAQRFVNDQVRDPNSPLAKNPEDYHLYMLGELDDETGIVEALEPIKHMNAVTQFLKVSPNEE